MDTKQSASHPRSKVRCTLGHQSVYHPVRESDFLHDDRSIDVLSSLVQVAYHKVNIRMKMRRSKRISSKLSMGSEFYDLTMSQ